MEVTFQLSPDDLWQFNLYVIRRVPAFRAIFISRILMLPFIAAAIGVLLLNSWLLGLLAFLAVGALWMPLVFWSSRRYNLRVINGRPGVLDRQTVSISADGLRQKTSHSETLMSWTGFVEIAQHPRFLVLFIDRRYGVIIPNSTFPSPEDARRFYENAVAYRQGLPAPVSPDTPTSWPPPPRPS